MEQLLWIPRSVAVHPERCTIMTGDVLGGCGVRTQSHIVLWTTKAQILRKTLDLRIADVSAALLV